MKTELISLDDHNKTANILYHDMLSPKPNGIACPNCGKELMDSSPHIQLTSFPPKYNVHCENESCKYTGYRN